MEEADWVKLSKRVDENTITENELLDITEGEAEHPEWWEHPCICRECNSCG